MRKNKRKMMFGHNSSADSILKKLWAFACWPFLILFFVFTSSPAFASRVYTIELNDDTINPVTAEYIIEAIDTAHENNAECLIIQLDTPGGLLSSTRTIVKKMLTSPVPLVVYIAPNGSRAGSAGVFLTYASHIAAMAPSTNIGAAHPVQLGDNGPKEEGNWGDLKKILEDIRARQEATPKENEDPLKSQDSKNEEDPTSKQQYPHDENPMESKILNDTVAFIKAIARERNRNEEWAIESVVKSSSITAQEALEKKVVELIASDPIDLLSQLDGREVVVNGHVKRLNTKNATVETIKMDARQRIFNALANPNIVYILFMIGFYGLLYEITHPGFGFPGIAGLICLIIAFYSMQALPTNYAGLALIVLGLVLMLTEAFTPGFGLFALGGVASLTVGSLFLFRSADPVMNISKTLIAMTAAFSVGFLVFLMQMLLKIRRRKPFSGSEGMINAEGEATVDILPRKEGKVFVHGELWNAVSDIEIKKGEKVRVIHLENLTLKVEPQKIKQN